MGADRVTPKVQQGVFLTARCRRACLARWSLRMKRLWHMGQANFFSPVWVRRWRDSSSERANRRSQPSHLHLNGFSPEDREKYIYYCTIIIIIIINLHYYAMCSSLTCMCPHVGLEMGALEVGFSTVFMWTNVVTCTWHVWLR